MVLALLTITGCGLTVLTVLGGDVRSTTTRLGSLPAPLLAVVATLGFQVTHFIEHGLQLGYWFGHTADKPWLTPWAGSAARALSTSALGVEGLHLIGNVIFFAGTVVLFVAVARGHRRRSARLALVIQSAHVVEHLALTASVAWIGRPIGVSTLFGSLQSGQGAWTYRVWLHFLVNLAATFFTLRAVAGVAQPTPGPQVRSARSMAPTA